MQLLTLFKTKESPLRFNRNRIHSALMFTFDASEPCRLYQERQVELPYHFLSPSDHPQVHQFSSDKVKAPTVRKESPEIMGQSTLPLFHPEKNLAALFLHPAPALEITSFERAAYTSAARGSLKLDVENEVSKWNGSSSNGDAKPIDAKFPMQALQVAKPKPGPFSQGLRK